MVSIETLNQAKQQASVVVDELNKRLEALQQIPSELRQAVKDHFEIQIDFQQRIIEAVDEWVSIAQRSNGEDKKRALEACEVEIEHIRQGIRADKQDFQRYYVREKNRLKVQKQHDRLAQIIDKFDMAYEENHEQCDAYEGRDLTNDELKNRDALYAKNKKLIDALNELRAIQAKIVDCSDENQKEGLFQQAFRRARILEGELEATNTPKQASPFDHLFSSRANQSSDKKKNPIEWLMHFFSGLYKAFNQSVGEGNDQYSAMAKVLPKAMFGFIEGFASLFLPKPVVKMIGGFFKGLFGLFGTMMEQSKKPKRSASVDRKGKQPASSSHEPDLEAQAAPSMSRQRGFMPGFDLLQQMQDDPIQAALQHGPALLGGLAKAFKA